MASLIVNSPARKQQALENPSVLAALVDRLTTGSPHARQACCTAAGALCDSPAGALALHSAAPVAVPAPVALANLAVAAVADAAQVAGRGTEAARAGDKVADSLGRALAALTTIETMSRNSPDINSSVLKTPGLLPAIKWLLEACTHQQVRPAGGAARRGVCVVVKRGG